MLESVWLVGEESKKTYKKGLAVLIFSDSKAHLHVRLDNV